MVLKIQNLDTATTDYQIEIEWSKLISKRNKLLEISDWSQLGDVFLTAESKKQWSIWRQKLRKVNRKTFTVLEDAQNVLELLNNEMPKSTTLDEAEFDSRIINGEITPTKEIHRITVKEQPIIIKEEIDTPRFEMMLKEILEKDTYGFKQYLLSFLDADNTNILELDETLEVAKSKAKEYAVRKQTLTLNKKLNYLPDVRILQQRAEEALEFLSGKNPDIENFPMIKMHAENMVMTHEESALNFLKQKKWYNHILLDSERFLYYTMNQIDAATQVNQIRTIIETIRYGY